ncbi:MAG: methylmalonyl Co-A mutase-associated GTPase MeaB [Deltaproteobacteria bacterium]|nr:methylmalonyl Co-A mutase-associated GTPase MeaB [Deltaproteobacteria bacterium]
MTGLVEPIVSGDVRAAARLMRDLDDRRPGAVEVLKNLFPHTGRAYVVGITGNPGAGKSTVVDALIERYRAMGKRVGVVAVDPTSPFSGGAILGDRIRMQRHATDPGVFIRSLATRGHLGGLSRSTGDVITVLDAMGFDLILVETVGVGQDEIDIISSAHTAVVVTVPGLGDDIQAIKAGILEIADVFCVNKADRDGVDRTVRDLLHMLELRGAQSARKVEIIKTVALSGQGIDELMGAVARHREANSGESGRARAQARAAAQVSELVKDQLIDAAWRAIRARGGLDVTAEAIVARKMDPYQAADEIVAEVLSSG